MTNREKEEAKAQRNAEYLAKLDKSIRQMKEGKVVTYTMEQMRAIEREY